MQDFEHFFSKLFLSLPLLYCESWMLVKEKPEIYKKNFTDIVFQDSAYLMEQFFHKTILLLRWSYFVHFPIEI